jgi:hypothetical protein
MCEAKHANPSETKYAHVMQKENENNKKRRSKARKVLLV